MRKWLSVGWFFGSLMLVSLAVAEDEPTSSSETTSEIRTCVENYVSAFNARDAKSLAQCWAPNAVYVDRDTGEEVRGREAIEKMFAEAFSADPRGQLIVTLQSIRLVNDTVAIEDGTASFVSPDEDPLVSTYTAVHVKTDEGWKLDSVRETVHPSTPPSAASEKLSSLAWMIGDWIDQSDDSTVETTCRWTKNKTFITRSFKVSAPGTDELEGTQVIGWDPLHQTVHSWLFDSDGGFLEGSWTEENGTWIVKSEGYLDDGRRASSVNLFTPIDDNSFTWQAINRRVDNEFIPDIEPVTVVRKPAPDQTAVQTIPDTTAEAPQGAAEAPEAPADVIEEKK